jgi:type I restriction enzyme S subunit
MALDIKALVRGAGVIDGLKPYPAYKDSGVPWLGQVPEHWEVLPGRAVFREINDRGHADEQMLSVTITRGVLRQTDLLAASSKKDSSNEDKSNYKLVQPGDLVYNKMRAWQGAVGVSAYRGIVSPAYIVQRLRNAENLPRYMHFLLRTPLFAAEAERWSYGITSDQWSLRTEDFKCIYFSLPPLPEQTAIVRFIDYMERRIRRVVHARQRQIKLLEEYRQALIHQAVTGQIDVRTGKPYPAYKDSGVEWLGKVPEHWEVRRLKRIARLNPSKSEVPIAQREGQAVFLPMERVGSDGRFEASDVCLISDLWNGFTYFRRGDVIVAKITPCFENGKGACLENLPTAIGFGSTEFHVIRPSKAIVSAYLYRVTTLSEFRRLGADEMTGAAGQQRVPVEFLANFPIPIPPLPEQTAIVEYLDAQTAKIDAAISAARREIELVREYRERLIADVVTGKVDVREVAARLPEEPPEEESEWIDTEEMAEGEETDEDSGAEALAE